MGAEGCEENVGLALTRYGAEAGPTLPSGHDDVDKERTEETYRGKEPRETFLWAGEGRRRRSSRCGGAVRDRGLMGVRCHEMRVEEDDQKTSAQGRFVGGSDESSSLGLGARPRGGRPRVTQFSVPSLESARRSQLPLRC